MSRPLRPALAALALIGGAAVAAPTPLIVSRADGVHRINVRGQVERTLTPWPVQWAVRLPDGSLAVHRARGGVYHVPLAGPPRPVARLPGLGTPEACTVSPPPAKPADPEAPNSAVGLDLQSPGDARASDDARWLCLSLFDRNENMADVNVDYAIDLKTGAVEAHMGLNLQCEALPQAATPPRARCAIMGPPWTPPGPPADRWPVRFDDDSSAITGADGTPALAFCAGQPADACDGAVSVAVSPSGRWRVLWLHTMEADYMHFAAFALDHKTGDLFPLREGPWPKALTPTERARVVRDHAAIETVDVVGGTATRATGHGERIAMGEYLITPGERVLLVGHLLP